MIRNRRTRIKLIHKIQKKEPQQEEWLHRSPFRLQEIHLEARSALDNRIP